MVGDSLHTDIAGAHRAGTDSLLVMTGVTALSDLVAARPDQRPTWVGHDLRALGRPGCAAAEHDGGWRALGMVGAERRTVGSSSTAVATPTAGGRRSEPRVGPTSTRPETRSTCRA